jgi:hypothetical protein
MLTAFLLVASLAIGPTPTPAVTPPALSRTQAVAEVGAGQDPGFPSWLALEEGLPATATASGPGSAPAVTCVTACTQCAAVHRSCCFNNMTQCFYCVPFGVKCL